MPLENENEVPTAPPTKKRNERTEAKFLEDVDVIIAEAERLAAEYQPPNAIAKLSNLKPKRDAVHAQRAVDQSSNAVVETLKNERERLYGGLSGDVTSLVEYAKSAGVEKNDLDALKSIARDIKGQRAGSSNAGDGGTRRISVSQMSFASRADNYARFIEQYDSLNIETEEDFYKAATHRAKLAAIRKANHDLINAEANADTSGETLDRLAYSDADSLLNGALSAKAYIKSKFKNSQSYKNISKTRLEMPSRLRKSK